MARQNPKATAKRSLEGRADATTNVEGGLAFKMEPKLELYTRVATALVGEPKFYDPESKGDDEIRRLIGEVAKTDPRFVIDLAIYARHELYLRTIPLVVLVEACRYPETRAFVRKAVKRIVTRADQITELVAAWRKAFGDIGNHAKKGMMSNPLRRGIADAFGNFTAYDLAKYDRDGEVKLRDVLRIAHPKPKNVEQAALWKQALDRRLTPPETWEVVISTKGSSKEAWESVLPKMGYMALLRNLRNFLDKDIGNLDEALKVLADPERVRRSKQFPFRFFSAYREISGHSNPKTTDVLDALEEALRASVVNVPHLPGTTFLSADNSGSMEAAISEKSKVQRNDVANVMQALAAHICDRAITSVFAESFAVVPTMKTGSLLDAVEKFKRTHVGMATNAYLAIDHLREKKIPVDRIVIFSDMQCYDTEARHPWSYRVGGERSLALAYREYVAAIGKTPYLYSIDLAGYGTAQFPPGTKVCMLAGWSDRILSFMDAFEKASNPEVVFEAIKKAGDVPTPKPEPEPEA